MDQYRFQGIRQSEPPRLLEDPELFALAREVAADDADASSVSDDYMFDAGVVGALPVRLASQYSRESQLQI